MGTCHSFVEGNETELTWVHDFASFEVGQFVRVGGRTKRVSSKVRMFNMISGKLPSGLVNSLARAAKDRKFEVEVVDEREWKPQLAIQKVNREWLHWFQEEAVTAALEKTRGVIKSPTGSGKTEIAAALVLSVNCKWLFLVHRKNLVQDFKDRFELRTGLRAAIFKKGALDTSCEVQVCTFKALSLALKAKDPHAIALVKGAEGLIVDECHVQAADSHFKVGMACEAYYRIGLSGTPFARGDKKSIMSISVLGEKIYEIETQMLIDEGFLARPTIYMTKVYQESQKKTYPGVYREAIVRSTKRNNIVADIVKYAPKPCIVFVTNIDHGKDLMKRLEKREVIAEFVWGKLKKVSQRKAVVRRLEYGDIEVIVSNVVFQEGVDIPSLASVVMAAGGKSAIATLQKIGRGMRSDQGKKLEFVVHDILDEGNKWLAQHATARIKTYKNEGHEVEVLDT